MNRTILLAIGGLALGLVLGTVGTLLLGAARAVAKHVGSAHRRTIADLWQYVAALGALLGFLLIAGGGALLVHELLPLSGPAKTVLAAGVGVLLFAGVGVSFSRIGDLAEEAKARKLPAPAYQQVRAPEPRVTTPPAAGPPAVAAPPAEPRATAPPAAAPLPAQPPTAQPPIVEQPIAEPPIAEQSGAVPPPAEPPTALPPAEPSSEAEPSPSPAEPAPAAPPAEPAPATSITDAEALLRAVRPGWIYRDQADHWYLGVVDEHTGSLPLLRLPDFALVASGEPAYPMAVAGAGEIAVVPLPVVPAVASEEEPPEGTAT